MNKKYESLAIIPARGGSKSIKNKNIKLFNGKPLIAWTIEQALSSNISKVVVSTDSKEIRDIALKYGAEVPYLRNKGLANDAIGIEPVIVDMLEHLKKYENYKPDCIALLLPTSPFRSVNDIDKSLEIYKNKCITSVVSVTLATANNNPHWMLKNNNNKVVMFNGDELEKMVSRRQDLPDYFIKNDFVFIINPKNLYLGRSNLYGGNVELMPISEDRIDIDINTSKDWNIAELLFKLI